MELTKTGLPDGVVTLALKGRLDAGTSAQAEAAIQDFLGAGGGKLILDLAGLDYISSAGLRVLLVANKAMRRKAGALALCGAQGNVREVLEVSGFTTLFLMADTPEQALAALRPA